MPKTPLLFTGVEPVCDDYYVTYTAFVDGFKLSGLYTNADAAWRRIDDFLWKHMVIG